MIAIILVHPIKLLESAFYTLSHALKRFGNNNIIIQSVMEKSVNQETLLFL